MRCVKCANKNRGAEAATRLKEFCTCPNCKGYKNRNANLCQNCYDATRIKRFCTCPNCNGYKNKNSSLCRKCYDAQRNLGAKVEHP